METNEAVAYARRARGERKRPSLGWESLTPTELDVVGHVASGLTNRQIGELMFISRGTVKAHLSHIFPKLGISSRSHLAAETAKRGPAGSSANCGEHNERSVERRANRGSVQLRIGQP